MSWFLDEEREIEESSCPFAKKHDPMCFPHSTLKRKDLSGLKMEKRKHVVGHILLNYSRHRETLAAVGGGGAQCLRIGGQEVIFVFDQILHYTPERIFPGLGFLSLT